MKSAGYSPSPSEPTSNGFSGPARRKHMEPMPAGGMTSAFPKSVLHDIPPVTDFLALPVAASNNFRDDFAPVVAQRTPPTFQDVSVTILRAYGQAPAAPPTRLTLANESHTHFLHTTRQQQSYGVPTSGVSSSQYQHYNGVHPLTSPDASKAAVSTGFQAPPQLVFEPTNHSPTGYPYLTPPTMTMMKPLIVEELRDSPPPADAMDRAVQNLVNLDDLRETKATPEQIKGKQQKELVRKTEHKSRPKAPAANGYHVGKNAALVDIKKQKQPVECPSKEVMKNHAFYAGIPNDRMIVVYGEPQPQPHGFPQAMGVPENVSVPGFGPSHHSYGLGQSYRTGGS
jgi:hypothetical protein